MAVEKMTERLDPLNDFLFLKFMGEKGDEVQLLAFLNAVLRRTGKDHLKSVEIIGDTKLPAEIIGDKSSVLDVRALTDDHTHINIEVQLRNLGTMDKRSLFPSARRYPYRMYSHRCIGNTFCRYGEVQALTKQRH